MFNKNNNWSNSSGAIEEKPVENQMASTVNATNTTTPTKGAYTYNLYISATVALVFALAAGSIAYYKKANWGFITIFSILGAGLGLVIDTKLQPKLKG